MKNNMAGRFQVGTEMLFIPEIFIKDCETDTFYSSIFSPARTVSSTSRQLEDKKEGELFDRLPTTFVNAETWTCKYNNLICWNCTYNVMGIPVFIPSKIDPIKKTMDVYGAFCTFACAASFIDEMLSSQATKNLYSIRLLYLYSLLYKKEYSYSKIRRSRSKFELRKFGGYIRQMDFHDENVKLDLCEI